MKQPARPAQQEMTTRQETTGKLLMNQVHCVAQLLEQDELVVRAVLSQAMDSVSTLIETSPGKLARKLALGTNDRMHMEVTRLIVSHVIGECRSEFRSIITNNFEAHTHVREVENAIAMHADLIRDILAERKTLSEIVNDVSKRDKLEEQMIAMMDEAKLQRHFANMLRMQEAVFRPLEEEDIPFIADLYREFMINGEVLIKMADGQQISKTFLAEPEEHEIPVMQRLLRVTKELQKHDNLHKRREKQTMVGTVLHSKVDKHALLAVYIRTRAPMNTKNDKEYREENEAYIEQGSSGGVMRYADMDQHGNSNQKDMFTEHLLGKGGRSEKVFLVISKEPGLGQQTQAESINTATDVAPGTKMITYARRKMNIKVNNTLIRRTLPNTRNTGSIRLLENGGMTVSEASDHNENAPFKRFTVTAGAIGEREIIEVAGRSDWVHLTGDFDEMIERARTVRST